MDVGIQMVFASYGWDDIKDSEVYREEVRLAQLADELGFDVLWSADSISSPSPPSARRNSAWDCVQ
jgi:alkanesulfonate monooxygenase SsuD/methylene tetrahydromethanopterin reductase-like flavin-dependent oxidoreductase (luciferase family)